MSRFLIAGLGSIGQRHARNLRRLYGDEVELLAYRVRGRSPVITELMTLDTTRTVEDTYNIRSFADLAEALRQQPSAVLVCNPTSEHLATALAAVRAGCHVFVEKPLASAFQGVEELIAEADARRLVAAVGYQLRAHPALHRLRALLGERAIGQVVSIRAEMGEYLPDAHPYEDYRESYAARAALGGGVLLCFIHEFDYLCWLFGEPRTVYAAGGTLGSLGLDVEDTVLTTLTFEVDGRTVPAQVHHTFLQRPPARGCVITGDAGVIELDLIASVLTVRRGAERIVERFTTPRNDLFLDELRAFVDAIHGGGEPLATARQGAVSLRVALAARRSLVSGRSEALQVA